MSTDIVVKFAPEIQAMLSDPAMAEVMAQFGITAEDVVVAPVAPTTTINFENLCTHHEPIEYNGYSLPHVGHTGPLMFLAVSEERESDAYEGYWGYQQVAALHPVLGKVLISVSIPGVTDSSGDMVMGDNDLLMFFRALHKGMVFTVARHETNTPGRHVYRPVPTQGV